jgi:predicted small secreted protein
MEGSMKRSPLLTIALVIVAILTTGCVGAAELVRALGQDPASVCVSVTTIYGKGAACRVGSAVEVKAGDGAISVTSK